MLLLKNSNNGHDIIILAIISIIAIIVIRAVQVRSRTYLN